MRRYLLFLLLLLPLFAKAQQTKNHVVYLTKDSFSYNLDADWRYKIADDSTMALPGYNDSSWEVVNPALWLPGGKTSPSRDTFKSIAWFRLHFIADTNIAGRPLGMIMTHFGASEIYLDGKKIKSWGKIKGKDSTENYDPQYVPFIIYIPTAGPHVLAVRYANYNAQKYYHSYNKTRAGFNLIISEANSLMLNRHTNAILNTLIFILLFGIFISLSFIHIFLFLYYRAAKSNLHFSIFCFSLALIFFIPFLTQSTHNPALEAYTTYPAVIAGALACFSMSGLINELFSKKKLRARIIKVLCILIPFIWLADIDTGLIALLVIIFLVSFEAVILTISAIYRKIKGARIIGFGILFFTLFILVVFAVGIISQGVAINDSTPGGQLLELILACSILSIPGSMSVYLAWSFARINKDLKIQLDQVEVLSARTLEQELEKQRILENQNEQLEKEVALRTAEIDKQHQELKAEKKKSDDLLNNILPEEVAEELKQKGISSAKFFDHVTVLFTDFVAFTKAGERMGPQELVDELHTCFKAFDDIISKYNIEKIKTIGDAYLAVCGLPLAHEDHALSVAKAALEIKQFMIDRKQRLGDKTFEIRIGIHSGSVVAGIVGVKKFAYDIWGDTVNTAARMEQNSEPGKINISQTTYELINDKFDCTYRGEITAKNKGELSMYFITGTKA